MRISWHIMMLCYSNIDNYCVWTQLCSGTMYLCLCVQSASFLVSCFDQLVHGVSSKKDPNKQMHKGYILPVRFSSPETIVVVDLYL